MAWKESEAKWIDLIAIHGAKPAMHRIRMPIASWVPCWVTPVLALPAPSRTFTPVTRMIASTSLDSTRAIVNSIQRFTHGAVAFDAAPENAIGANTAAMMISILRTIIAAQTITIA